MEANIEDVIVGLIIENESPEEALNDLRKDGNWNSDNADVVSQFAAKALNIRINIFDKKEAVESKRIMYSKEKKANGTDEKKYRIDPAQPAKIIRYAFEPEGFVGVETINLLRVGNSHYELLYPNAAPVALPKGRRITAKKANETYCKWHAWDARRWRRPPLWKPFFKGSSRAKPGSEDLRPTPGPWLKPSTAWPTNSTRASSIWIST
jgi:hypothetical protein